MLYADDTLLFSETYEGMQNLLDVFSDYHYLFICNNTEIQSLRSKYIPKYYVQNSSVAKMAGIFSLCNSELLKSVALFLKGIGKLF